MVEPINGLATRMGKRLKELRKTYGFTQTQVADYLGIDQSNYSKIEHGKRRLNKMHQLKDLSNLYGCTEEYLLCESDEYTPNKISGADGVDLNVIAQMNSTMNYLKLLRQMQSNENSGGKPVGVVLPSWNPNEPRFVVKDCHPQVSDDRQFKNGKCVFNQRLGFAYSVDEIVEVLNRLE